MTSPSPSPTPARNNYAAPHTPIASVKRPRSSLGESGRRRTSTRLPPSSAPLTTEEDSSSSPHDDEPQSPMHPPRPVLSRTEEEGAASPAQESSSWVNKVDALFSPVLNFLSTKDEADDDIADVTDEDATMEDTLKPATADTVGTLDEDDDETPADQPVATASSESDEAQEEEEDELSEGLEEDPSSSFEEEEFNPYLFIKSLPGYDLVAPLRPPLALPDKADDTPPISLVLDLDETLVHCTVEATDDADLVFPVEFHNMTYKVHVRLRPHLFEFLERIQGKFEVIVFTASQKVYANELLNLIDPEGKYIQHRMYRESCLPVEGNFLKDLNVLNRDLTKTVLVDNSPHAFGYQVDNGIPIESWFDDPHDTELLKLERFLRTLHRVNDVRTAVRERFQTYRLIQEA